MALLVAIVAVRGVAQRVAVHQASLLIWISRVFRDHRVKDYRVPRSATLAAPSTVRMERLGEIKDGLL